MNVEERKKKKNKVRKRRKTKTTKIKKPRKTAWSKKWNYSKLWSVWMCGGSSCDNMVAGGIVIKTSFQPCLTNLIVNVAMIFMIIRFYRY